MKTIIKSEESGVYEIVKRIMFAAQLLVVSIAIPLLFVIGISNREQKRLNKPEENTEITSTQFSSHPIGQLTIAKI